MQVGEARNRIEAVKWMKEWKAQHGEVKGVVLKACVDNFPQLFRSSYKANIEKARSWWMLREIILKDVEDDYDDFIDEDL